MAVTDWIANLFQSEQTRGLSGGGASSVALDDSNPYYNYRLRRHQAEGDIVADPGLLWFTSAYVKQRGGLGTHIASELGEGVAGFTDVLLILSREDFKRAIEVSPEPWLQTATRVMLQEFEDYSRRESFSRRFAHRQLGFRILCDGSADMGGHALGLESGEFVTGLLPNLYTGPVRGSHPVIGVHVNLPGVWEGYQEVGRLYNDQVLFTLGNSWLDNFSHPSLKEAALYRLQQYPDGSFVHIVNPDLQDRYQVTATEQGGASVLTLSTRDGEPLAYLVLAIIEAPLATSADDLADPQRTIPPPMLIDGELQRIGMTASDELQKSKTIIPEAPAERIFTLQERGALLQKVHFGNFMLGYDVYLGSRGELGTVVDERAATFQVRKRSVSLVAYDDGVLLDGQAVEPGVEVPIEGDVIIEIHGQRLEYRDLRGRRVDRWPYVGEIRRPASSNYLVWGESYLVGRSRECRVILPDEPANENIAWKPSVGDGATIRARTGDIPKSRFYTDSIMVASEHAVVSLSDDEPFVECRARHCFVYVRRGDAVFPLYPTTSGKEPTQMPVEPGDEVLIGNCLFHVGFVPAGESVLPAPAPKIELSSDSLVDAVSTPDFADLDAPSQPDASDGPTVGLKRPSPEDAAAAFGLGERGHAPKPVPIERVGADSILGIFDDGEPGASPFESVSDIPGPVSLDEPSPFADAMAAIEDEAVDDHPTIPGASLPAELLEEALSGSGSTTALDLYDEEEDADDYNTTQARAGKGLAALDGPEAEAEAVEAQWDDEDSWTGSQSDGDVEPSSTWDEQADSMTADSAMARKVHDSTDDLVDPAVTVPRPFPEVQEPEEAPVAAPTAVETISAAEPLADPDAHWGQVVAVDDEEAQFELGRRMQLVHVGWMVAGEVICGNHSKADLVLPENRIVEDQVFEARDYFKLKVRGRRGKLELLASSELLIDGADAEDTVYKDPEGMVVEVIRRDDEGEEDFVVRLELVADGSLPNPRARLLALDADDDLAAALVTRGLPTRKNRVLNLQGLVATFHYDGSQVTISDYLATYAQGDGFLPFFVQQAEARFQTAPEDGAAIVVKPGDRLVIGRGVYLLREG